MYIMKRSILSSTFFYITSIVILLTGCSSKPTTYIDFNPNTNFSSLTSFQFSPAPKASLDGNPIMLSRIQSATEDTLLAQGLTKQEYLDFKSADLTIKVNFNQQVKPNNSSLSIGFGTGRVGNNGAGSIGVSTNVPLESDDILITQIIIDMSHNGIAVWHGKDSYEASRDVSSEELNNLVKLTVNTILANFPPNSNGDGNKKATN